MARGWFITFEGPDGSGKTTQIQLLQDFLTAEGCPVLLTREPGGTRIGEKIRELILDREYQEMDAATEALLYAASRAQHVAQVIRPALAAGKTVICDRFVDSSVAYQGYGRGLGGQVELINQMATEGLKPDLTVLLMVKPDLGRARVENGREGEIDRLEGEAPEYRQRVYRGYCELAEREPERIMLIDGAGTIEDISARIRSRIGALLEKKE